MRSNKSLAPRTKTIYVYHSGDNKKHVCIARINNVCFGIGTKKHPVSILIDSVNNSLNLFLSSGYRGGGDIVQYVSKIPKNYKKKKFPVIEIIDDEVIKENKL